MKVICAPSAVAVPLVKPDILVLPERVSLTELRNTTAAWPNAVIVAATEGQGPIRGHFYWEGVDRVDYQKVLGDGRTRGALVLPRAEPFYETPHLAVGMLICRDFECNELREGVLERLRKSRAETKVLCIPADMGSQFFVSDEIRFFSGTFVAMSNLPRNDAGARCKSFILSPDGKRIAQQFEAEAIYAHTR